MKKIRFTKKKKKNGKNSEKTKFNSLLKKLCLTIYIFVIIIIMTFFLIKIKTNKSSENEINNNDSLLYKGSKIKKNKLLANYLSRISGGEEKIANEKRRFYKYFNLSEYTSDPISQNYFKNQFIGMFAKIKKKKSIKNIETFYVEQYGNFGNNIIILNNIIFCCEIIGCNKIILNYHKTRKWFIKNPIYIEKLNITIQLGPEVYCGIENVFCIKLDKWDPYYPVFVKPQIRIQYIKEEIVKNLPEVNINSNDLYIHIRGGDIFKHNNASPYYAQPPLCFYEKIINNNKFNNIYIISQDRRNPVLDALISKHNNIIFKENNYEYDISLLVHAFNLVASVSSFVLSSIKFNDNLKNLWEYDIYRLSEKFIQLHHHLYKFDIKYKIYTLKPSDIYADQMHIWTKSESQLKLMLEDSCPYDFVLTKPN